MVIVEDQEGGTEKVEENLAKVNGVNSIEVTDTRRLM
ncbi:MAG TPA: elongation factor 1-beta, partial [Methanobacterium sp.]|nr:elongation factor 1-beta [Methanobacterium sp.]